MVSVSYSTRALHKCLLRAQDGFVSRALRAVEFVLSGSCFSRAPDPSGKRSWYLQYTTVCSTCRDHQRPVRSCASIGTILLKTTQPGSCLLHFQRRGRSHLLRVVGGPEYGGELTVSVHSRLQARLGNPPQYFAKYPYPRPEGEYAVDPKIDPAVEFPIPGLFHCSEKPSVSLTGIKIIVLQLHHGQKFQEAHVIKFTSDATDADSTQENHCLSASIFLQRFPRLSR